MEAATITDPAILIKINRTYRQGMSETALYEATRGTWVLGDRRERAELAMAVVDGVIVGVFEIDDWHQAGSTPYPLMVSHLFDLPELTIVGSGALESPRREVCDMEWPQCSRARRLRWTTPIVTVIV